jgi:hypothetical protein
MVLGASAALCGFVTGLMMNAAVPARLAPAAPANGGRSNFAGYQASPGHLNSASTAFTVPVLSCPRRGVVGITPEVQLANSSKFSGGGVFAVCQGGGSQYFAFAVIKNSQTNLSMPIRSGDQMTVSASETSSGTSVTVTDLTHRASKTTTGPGGAVTSTAIGDGGVLSNGVLVGVPPFGKLAFSQCYVNGASLGSTAPTAFDRVKGTTLQIKTAPLNALGNKFTTTFKHS